MIIIIIILRLLTWLKAILFSTNRLERNARKGRLRQEQWHDIPWTQNNPIQSSVYNCKHVNGLPGVLFTVICFESNLAEM